jgi:hypothetical protein
MCPFYTIMVYSSKMTNFLQGILVLSLQKIGYFVRFMATVVEVCLMLFFVPVFYTVIRSHEASRLTRFLNIPVKRKKYPAIS